MKLKDFIDELKELDQEAEIFIENEDEWGDKWLEEMVVVNSSYVQEGGNKVKCYLIQ